MREIKFKVWSDETKKLSAGFSVQELADMTKPRAVVTPAHTFLQYTGMKDRNSKEIYEGDIIEFYWRFDERYDGGPAEVHFAQFTEDNDTFIQGWVAGKKGGQRWIDLCPLTEHCRVLGNIYENPDLLK